MYNLGDVDKILKGVDKARDKLVTLGNNAEGEAWLINAEIKKLQAKRDELFGVSNSCKAILTGLGDLLDTAKLD